MQKTNRTLLSRVLTISQIRSANFYCLEEALDYGVVEVSDERSR